MLTNTTKDKLVSMKIKYISDSITIFNGAQWQLK